MTGSAIRRALAGEGEPVFGSFVYLRDPAAVEIAAAAGLDFVIIDAEHSARSASNQEELIRAAEAFGVTALIRTSSSELAGLALDGGAQGIVLPHFGAHPASQDAALWLRFAPGGRRGACRTVRATRYGRVGLADYAEAAERDLCLVGLIEDPGVIDDLDRLLASPGLDVVLPGPGDLAVALGCPGQVDDPRVVEAVGRIVDAVARADQPPALAMTIGRPEDASAWFAAGIRIFVCDIDESVLLRGYSQMHERFAATVATAGRSSA